MFDLASVRKVDLIKKAISMGFVWISDIPKPSLSFSK
jgi:hypothetical protein